MGNYLNMLNSAKPATINGVGQIANENYAARELMQLFTLGLDLLNQDGSLQLDGNGNPMIPAYTEAQVQAFARAYTGWTYALPGRRVAHQVPQRHRRLGRILWRPCSPRMHDHRQVAKLTYAQRRRHHAARRPDRRQQDLTGALDQYLQPPQYRRSLRLQASSSSTWSPAIPAPPTSRG